MSHVRGVDARQNAGRSAVGTAPSLLLRSGIVFAILSPMPEATFSYFLSCIAAGMAILAILLAFNGDIANAKAAIAMGGFYAAAYFWWASSDPYRDDAP